VTTPDPGGSFRGHRFAFVEIGLRKSERDVSQPLTRHKELIAQPQQAVKFSMLPIHHDHRLIYHSVARLVRELNHYDAVQFLQEPAECREIISHVSNFSSSTAS
jgi:hypothetical protein